jgi:hypothetical protein
MFAIITFLLDAVRKEVSDAGTKDRIARRFGSVMRNIGGPVELIE